MTSLRCLGSFIFAFATLLLGAPAFAQSNFPTDFTVEGRLYDSGGAALNQSGVTIMLEVVDDSNSNCVLYREVHTSLNLSSGTASAQGVFAVRLGTGSARYNPTPLGTIFTNAAGMPGILEGTGSACSPAPTNSTHRMVKVKVWDSAGGTWSVATSDTDSHWDPLLPDTKITVAPQAMVADSAESLQGHQASEFLLTNTSASSSLTQFNVESVFANSSFTKLQQLLNGTSTQYITSTPTTDINMASHKLTNLNAPTAAGDAATKAYTDSTLGGLALNTSGVGLAVGDGKTLVWDQATTSWVARTPLNLIASGNGLTGGPITTAGTLSVDVGTTANKILQLNASAQIPAVDGSLLSNVNASKLATRAVSTSSPSANQVLGYNALSSQWEPMSASGGTITGLTGDVTASGSGVVAATIQPNAITSAKINNTSIAVNRLLITDASTGATVGYSSCALGELLQWTATGWACKSVALMLGPSSVTAGTYGSATQVTQVGVDAQGRVQSLSNVNIAFPVTTVAGRTGAVTLNAGDVSGLGTAAIQNVGTGVNNVLQFSTAGQLPALDGSLLTNANAFSIRGTMVSATAPTTGQYLVFNGSSAQWEPSSATNTSQWTTTGSNLYYNVGNVGVGTTLPDQPLTVAGKIHTTSGGIVFPDNSVQTTAYLGGGGGSVTTVGAGNGLLGGNITVAGTLSVDVGTTANKILQLDATASIPAVNGANLTNINAARINTYNVVSTTPVDKQVLTFNAIGSQWEPQSVAAGSTGQIQVNNAGNLSASSNLVFQSGKLGVNMTPSFPLDVAGAIEFTGGSRANDGTMTSPAYTFSASPNTGMYRDNTNGDLVLGANSAEVIRLEGTGGGLVVGGGLPASTAIAEFNGLGPRSAIILPRDLGSNRPTGVNGMIRFNTSTNSFEAYNGLAWNSFATGSNSPWLVSGSNLYYTSGNVAIGAVPSSSAALMVTLPVDTPATADTFGQQVTRTATPTGSTGRIYGTFTNVSTSGSTPNTGEADGAFNKISIGTGVASTGDYYGSRNQVAQITNNATSGNIFGTSGEVIANGGANSVSKATGVLGSITGSGTITNAFGLRSTFSPTGTITNAYGLYVDPMTASGTLTNHWAIYQSSNADPNYFAGKVGIGTTTPSSVLDVNGSVRVGNDASICGVANGGAIRFSASSLQYCDGTSTWQPLAASGVATSFNAGTIGSPGLAISGGGGNTGFTQNGVNTIAVSTGGLEAAQFNYNSGATDYLTFTPGTAASGVMIGAGGTDSNVNLVLAPKGAGSTIFQNPSVAIGTSSPGRALDVVVYDSTSYSPQSFASSTPTSNTSATIRVANPTMGSPNRGAFYEMLAVNTTTSQSAYMGAVSYGNGSNYSPAIVFGQQTGTSSYQEAMRIDGTGNLGLGTSSPVAKVDIEGTDTGVQVAVTNTNSSSSSPQRYPGFAAMDYLGTGSGTSALVLGSSRGSLGGAQPTLQGDLLGAVVGQGNTLVSASPTMQVAAGMTFQAEQTFGSSFTPTYIGFSTNPNGPSGNLQERMRITSAGQVAIGTSSASALLTVGSMQPSSSVYSTISTTAGNAYFSGPFMTINAGDLVVPQNPANASQARTVIQTSGGSTFQVDQPYTMNISDNFYVYHPVVNVGNGNVGIGTSTPLALLDVEGGGGVILNSGVGIGTTSLTSAQLSVQSSAIPSSGSTFASGTGTFNISYSNPGLAVGDTVVPSTAANSPFTITGQLGGTSFSTSNYFATGVNDSFTIYKPSLVIPSYGTVGIGTPTPTAHFDVEGVGGVVLNSGAVGIGTQSMGAMLDVNPGISPLGVTASSSGGTSITLTSAVTVNAGDQIGVNGQTYTITNSGTISSLSVSSAVTPTFSGLPFTIVKAGYSAMRVRAGGTSAFVITPGGAVGIGTAAPSAGLDVSTTGAASAIVVPRDTTFNRPASAIPGMVRLNTTSGAMEGYANSTWGAYPRIVARFDAIAQAASIPSITLIPSVASNTLYAFRCNTELTQAATSTPAAVPNCTVTFTSADSPFTSHTVNVVGTCTTNTTSCFSNGTLQFYARAGSSIQLSTPNYSSTGATSLQYSVHAVLEELPSPQ